MTKASTVTKNSSQSWNTYVFDNLFDFEDYNDDEFLNLKNGKFNPPKKTSQKQSSLKVFIQIYQPNDQMLQQKMYHPMHLLYPELYNPFHM